MLKRASHHSFTQLSKSPSPMRLNLARSTPAAAESRAGRRVIDGSKAHSVQECALFSPRQRRARAYCSWQPLDFSTSYTTNPRFSRRSRVSNSTTPGRAGEGRNFPADGALDMEQYQTWRRPSHITHLGPCGSARMQPALPNVVGFMLEEARQTLNELI